VHRPTEPNPARSQRLATPIPPNDATSIN
jgi:hypothetical protein